MINFLTPVFLLVAMCWPPNQTVSAGNKGHAYPTFQASEVSDFRNYTDSLAGEFVAVRGGTFQMGSDSDDPDEAPIHSVMIEDFWMGKFEITQAQWRNIMGTNPSMFSGCDQCPVEQVSWFDVQLFIQRLNAKVGLTYRLPTEAEWEYAAGGGSAQRTRWAGTNEETQVENFAWFALNSGNKTQVVGLKKPNTLGIFDMSGNVWEWCEDDWHDSYLNAPQDGSPWVNLFRGPTRVYRGGGWFLGLNYCRVSHRFSNDPENKSEIIGFRLVRQLAK